MLVAIGAGEVLAKPVPCGPTDGEVEPRPSDADPGTGTSSPLRLSGAMSVAIGAGKVLAKPAPCDPADGEAEPRPSDAAVELPALYRGG
ncbi:hypothetical protein WMF27_32730 [Sorangium sp. So ce281]|uniref:hypothetical protein n=1 Tax=unclassified Sorangium TaxID=2621164 RepID=UPI003F5FFF80